MSAIPRSQRGFTIVELLIVIVVIGILAAITVVAFNGVQDRARNAALQSDIKQGINQVEMLRNNSGDYPATIASSSFQASTGTTLTYQKVGSGYCLTASNPTTGSYFSATSATPGVGPCPLAYWPLDGSADDKSPYGNNGTLTAVTVTADHSGKANAAYSFTGTTPSKITLPSSGPYVSVGTQSFTVSAWVKTSESLGQRCVVSTAASSQGFRFGYGGGMPYYLVGNGTNYQEGTIGSTMLNDGAWHLLTIVYAYGTGWVVSSYIDGQPTGSVTLPTTITSASSGYGYIGTMGGGTNGAVTGSIDDVRIYDHALTPTEIKQLYQMS